MLQNWSSVCLQKHASYTQRNQDQRLPTRVLDVGTTDMSKEPYLFETNGAYGSYATLSHRWGDMSIQFQTIKANLKDHKTGISFDTFPVLFQDAVKVTRFLGIQYLWIDCLCIIQDDDEDWARECEKMSSIYENSFLTISALLANHSGQSLFALRSQSLMSAVKSSVLNTRGWIFQERVLGPAILESQMYWECPGGQAEEIYPVIQNHATSLAKSLFHESQRPGCELYPGGHYIAWYKIIEIYKNKILTVETDRLTAILGLAKRFEKLFGTGFLGELWVEDLHRGPLWREMRTFGPEESNPDFNQRWKKQQVIAPSWSWANLSAPVEFEWDVSLGDFTRIHPVTRISSTTDAEFVDAYTRSCKNKHRGSLKGFIQIWAVVKRVQ
ncbi:HET-domain-containing protein [Stipitochalara longipes BDJ]|nr:HET-domain-containing protein [Stipitochalara longipes BDJ]